LPAIVDYKESFTEQLEQCHRQLFHYIFALVRNLDDSQDLFQQTVLLLWEKFGDFQPGTNFPAWACAVARYKVRNFFKTRRRQFKCLSDVFAEKLAALQASIPAEEIDDRRAALAICVEKLTPQQKGLLKRRYGGNSSVSSLAEELGRPVRSVHNSLRNIRELLLQCVNRSITGKQIPVGRGL
jgi:RNA polymerase sigma-70 factor (ECF subfamily)